MAAHSRILAWRIHAQRTLEGYSLRGRTALDMTERTHTCNWVMPSTTPLCARAMRGTWPLIWGCLGDWLQGLGLGPSR